MLFVWQQLAADPSLQQAAAATDPTDPAAVMRLRRDWPAELVHAALDLADGRRRAATKFDEADRLLLDREGAEQASSLAVARHKATRFAQLGRPVVDLCCGIGGDAMALSEHMDVTLIDRLPHRAWIARANVSLHTGHAPPAAVADVSLLNLRNRALHLDPARRDAAGRIHRYGDYQPPPEVIEALLAGNPTAGIKLSPGIETEAVPSGELEFISEAGTLVQAVRWTGELQRHERTATVIDVNGTATSIHGTPAPPPFAPIADYLFAVDPAAERAELMHVLCEQLELACVHPALGLLTGDRPVDSPFLTAFGHLETMPWRPKKVRRWLADHDAGVVEVKTRGKAVNPDRVQHELRGRGGTTYTLFVYRHDQRVLAHVTRRVDS